MFCFGILSYGQSLVPMNIDDLSDDQIISLYNQGEARGYSIERVEELAQTYGFSDKDATEFKFRLENLLISEKYIEKKSRDFVQFDESPSDQDQNKNIYEKGNDEEKSVSNIFGHSYFNSKIDSFDKSNGAKAPDNYTIGFGDELTISIFGISFFQGTFKVNNSGAIDLGSRYGQLKLAGLSFDKTQKLLRSKFSSGFDLSKNTIDVTLSYSRLISVNVIGEVVNPGTYSFNALNNPFHALAFAGGPNNLASIRNVKLYRDGKIKDIIDFYDFFVNPEDFKIPFLEDGDFLMIPSYEILANVSGAFKRQMNYEMLADETIDDLLRFTAGFDSYAYDDKIKIYRKEGKENIILDVQASNFQRTPVLNGDSIYANYKEGELDKFVNISGAVAQPGDYGFVNDMSLEDLINLSGGIMGRFPDKEVILSRLEENGKYRLYRIELDNNISNFKLNLFDYISVSARVQNLNNQKISVLGSVNSPGDFKYSDGMTLDDALKMASGLLDESDNERIEITRKKIIRKSSGTLELKHMSYFTSVDSSMLNNWTQDYIKSDFQIMPYDIIIVRSVKDFHVKKVVFVGGEVKYPGRYSLIGSDEKVSDILERCGGLTNYSDPFNAKMYRHSDSNLVFRLDRVLDNGKFNYRLRASDSIFVPKTNDLVFIQGDGHQYFEENNMYSIQAPFSAGYRARRYLNLYALGASSKADLKNISVPYANGKYDRSKRFLFWNISPVVKNGGRINVNKKKTKLKKKREEKPIDWNQVVSTLTSAAMGFGTVYAILNRP